VWFLFELLLGAGMLCILLGALLACACIVAALVERLLRRPDGLERRFPIARWMAPASIVLALVVGPLAMLAGCTPYLAPTLWHESVAEHGDRIVAAIRRHERDTGRPPAELHALLPEYLASWPDSGFVGRGSWSYAVRDSTWELRLIVENPFSGGESPRHAPHPDEFRYAPGTGGTVPTGYRSAARVRDWLYLEG